MYVTIVEGAIDAAREDDLRSAWEDTTSGDLPDGFIESSLLRADDGTWQIVTVDVNSPGHHGPRARAR